MTKRNRKPAAAQPDAEPPPIRRGAETIEQWPIERFRAYMRNSRTHPVEQVRKIAASIERFGFTNPILAADDGTIIAGHGRVLAAQLLKLDTLPVIVATGWTEDERKAFVIADNKLAQDSGWDEEMLKLEMTELHDAGFDLTLTGFDDKAIAAALGNEDDDPEPDAPDLQPVYQILVDCTDEAEQLALLEELQRRELKVRALIA